MINTIEITWMLVSARSEGARETFWTAGSAGMGSRPRDRMTERIQCLIRNRDAIGEYLDAVRATGRPDPASEAPPVLS